MREILFHLFAALTLVPAIFVALSRNPVNAAMNMILSFVGLAALFVMLETYFLAILQILVYAGAIVVLFLFIIMLIDSRHSPKAGLVSSLAATVALALMVTGLLALVYSGESGPFAEAGEWAPAAEARIFGEELFTRYLLPFQVTGFMLLMAMIGVIVISRKDPNVPEEGPSQ